MVDLLRAPTKLSLHSVVQLVECIPMFHGMANCNYLGIHLQMTAHCKSNTRNDFSTPKSVEIDILQKFVAQTVQKL